MLERWVPGLDSPQGSLGLTFEFENGWAGLILQPITIQLDKNRMMINWHLARVSI